MAGVVAWMAVLMMGVVVMNLSIGSECTGLKGTEVALHPATECFLIVMNLPNMVILKRMSLW
jgi:hypothetical protein